MVEIVKGPELVSLDSKKFQAHKVMNLRKLIQFCVLFHRRRMRMASCDVMRVR